MSPKVAILVAACGRCGEREMQLVQMMAYYLVECELCGATSPIQETTEKAVLAWNEKQRCMRPVKGNDYEH